MGVNVLKSPEEATHSQLLLSPLRFIPSGLSERLDIGVTGVFKHIQFQGTALQSFNSFLLFKPQLRHKFELMEEI